MPKNSKNFAPTAPTVRSRVTNGKDLFLDFVDGRSKIYRRYRDIYGQIIADLGGDPTEAQNALARRAATLAAWCELEEASFVAGGAFAVDAYASTANTLRRLLVSLGLKRHARDITPSIDAYLQAREASDDA